MATMVMIAPVRRCAGRLRLGFGTKRPPLAIFLPSIRPLTL